MKKLFKAMLAGTMCAVLAFAAGCGDSGSKKITYEKANSGLEVVQSVEDAFQKHAANYKDLKWKLTNKADNAQRDANLKKNGLFYYNFEGIGKDKGCAMNLTICPHKELVIEGVYDTGIKDNRIDWGSKKEKLYIPKSKHNFMNSSIKENGKSVRVCKHFGKVVKFEEPMPKK